MKSLCCSSSQGMSNKVMSIRFHQVIRPQKFYKSSWISHNYGKSRDILWRSKLWGFKTPLTNHFIMPLIYMHNFLCWRCPWHLLLSLINLKANSNYDSSRVKQKFSFMVLNITFSITHNKAFLRLKQRFISHTQYFRYFLLHCVQFMQICNMFLICKLWSLVWGKTAVNNPNFQEFH